jgi:gliding motility-associated-like protein
MLTFVTCMKTPFTFLTFVGIVALLISQPINAQCENTDFGYGNFTNWNGYTGMCCGAPINTPGIVQGRHTIITESTWDPYTNDSVPTMPPVGSGAYSVRLGNDQVGSEAESLERPFLVTSDNRLFVYQYALILQDPEGHPPIDKPKFEVRVFDEDGNIVNPPECGYYQVTAGPETDNWGQNGDVRYKNWSTVGIDLSDYIGTEVTIQFTVQDCGWGGHFGYAYLDASCGYLDIEVIGFCEGNTSVTLIAPGGFDAYYWPHSGETTQTVVIPMPEVGDSIEVAVTNQSGCATTILHVFEEYPLVDAGVGNDTLICAGQPVDLACVDAGQNANYDWYANGDPISTDQTLTVTPLETTVYEVLVSNPNGCFSPDSSASLTVTVNNELVFALTPSDTLICFGESITLQAPLAGYTYLWHTAEDTLGTNASLTVNPAQSTVYHLQISHGDCSYTDSIQVFVFDAATLPDSISTDYCEDAATLVLSGPSGYSYLWDDGSTTQDITINPAIDILRQLQVISPEGCADSILYLPLETAFPVPSASAADDTICMGHGVSLNAVNAGPNATYHWTSSDGDLNAGGGSVYVFPTHPTTYFVQATSAAGCSGSISYDTLTICIDSSAYFAFSGPVNICEGFSDTLFAPISALTYEWSIEEDILSTDSLLPIAPSQSQSYYLTTYSASCIYATDLLVVVHNVEQRGDTIYSCSTNSEVSIPAPSGYTIPAPSGYTSVYWPTFNNNDTSNVVVNPFEGQIVPVLATNFYTCVDTFLYHIDLLAPTVLLPLLNDSICYGDPVSLSAQSDYAFDTYNWTSDSTGTSTSGPVFTTTGLATTTYTVSVSNPYDCIAAPTSQSAVITVQDNQLLQPFAPVTVCPGTEVNLSSPGTTGIYSWTFTSSQSSQPTFNFTPEQSGNVFVTVTDGVCTHSIQIPVTIFAPYLYILSANPADICSGDAATLTVQPGLFNHIDWVLNTTVFSTAASTSVSPATNTLYTANVTDPNGCAATASQTLTVSTVPSIDLGPDVSICATPVIMLSSPSTPNTYGFDWSTGAQSPAIEVGLPGSYSLTVTNGNCSASDTIAVLFILDSYLGDIPNVFSPNADGVNDLFAIETLNLEAFELVILNRWGSIVFSSSDLLDVWDGTEGSHAVEEGVYFYRIAYRLACAEEMLTVQGYVTVVR